MVVTAQHVRTSLAFAAISGTLVAAALLHMRSAPTAEPPPIGQVDATTDDGMALTARLTTAKLLVGAHAQDIAISITAPGGHVQTRPPLSLAVVIDRSGSMHGIAMENAKTAAMRVIDQLDADDAFTVVTFSSSSETVVPLSRATVAGKGAARAAIARIFDDGGTCISCGITRGVDELARSPISGGLRRMVMMSDGQANEGLWDRGELAQLAAQTAAKGVSISTVGVGLDFDEVTMANLASVGHGNYYFVEDTANLSTMFAHELGGLADTVASDARLELTTGPGVSVIEAYGYPMVRRGDETVIPIADLRAGETRKVVIRVMVAAPIGALDVAQVHLAWRRVADGSLRNATTTASATVVDDPAQVAASVDHNAVRAAEQAQTAHALEQATQAYEKDGYDAARKVMQQRADTLRANAAAIGDPKLIEQLTTEGDAMIQSIQAEPAKAKKAMRVKAYELAR